MRHQIKSFFIFYISMLLGYSTTASAEDEGFLDACLVNVQCANLYFYSLGSEESKEIAMDTLPRMFEYNSGQQQLDKTDISKDIEDSLKKTLNNERFVSENSDEMWRQYLETQRNIRILPDTPDTLEIILNRNGRSAPDG